jgi:hypothetical protein
MDGSERRLRRRTFMRLLGAGAAAPLAAQMASWVHADPGDRPVRLMIFYVPHGWPIEHVDPGGQGNGFFTGDVLSPLAPIQDQVTIVRGLSMHDGATNHAALPTVLTGFANGGDDDSVDRRIAEGLGVPAHVLGTVPYASFAGFTVDSFLTKHGGAWVRPTESPVDAAETLLGKLGSGAEPKDGPSEADFRREALALTEQELETMHDAVADLTSEQTKLSLHLEAVRALKAGGGGPNLVTCDEAPVLPAVDAMQGLDALDPANFGRVLDGHLEVIAASLICGTAQVVTLQNMYVNGQVPFDFAGGPGIAKGHHDPISHSWDGAGRVEFATCQRWFYERLYEKLLTQLASTPDPSDTDPNHSVLDNTLIYCSSEISDGANHNSDASQVWIDGAGLDSYLPTVLIGGAGGCLRTGEVINVNGRHNLEMLATLGEMMGVSGLQLGGQTPDIITEVLA